MPDEMEADVDVFGVGMVVVVSGKFYRGLVVTVEGCWRE